MKNYVSREQTPSPGTCEMEAVCRCLHTAGVGSLLRVGGSCEFKQSEEPTGLQ
jgi:hypothetical protein